MYFECGANERNCELDARLRKPSAPPISEKGTGKRDYAANVAAAGGVFEWI